MIADSPSARCRPPLLPGFAPFLIKAVGGIERADHFHIADAAVRSDHSFEQHHV
jgi:hypothetical protein